ncbi:Peptidylprolyl isomerase [Psidium guajava]|nr:Peptidylprolyl isomerase [Psidium guajava]
MGAKRKKEPSIVFGLWPPPVASSVVTEKLTVLAEARSGFCTCGKIALWGEKYCRCVTEMSSLVALIFGFGFTPSMDPYPMDPKACRSSQDNG